VTSTCSAFKSRCSIPGSVCSARTPYESSREHPEPSRECGARACELPGASVVAFERGTEDVRGETRRRRCIPCQQQTILGRARVVQLHDVRVPHICAPTYKLALFNPLLLVTPFCPPSPPLPPSITLPSHLCFSSFLHFSQSPLANGNSRLARAPLAFHAEELLEREWAGYRDRARGRPQRRRLPRGARSRSARSRAVGWTSRVSVTDSPMLRWYRTKTAKVEGADYTLGSAEVSGRALGFAAGVQASRIRA